MCDSSINGSLKCSTAGKFFIDFRIFFRQKLQCQTVSILPKGIAYRNGACTINSALKIYQGVAVVEDDVGYKGIIPATHEVAHL